MIALIGKFPDLRMFAKSGIYFLFRADVVVYVGQAVDVRRRIADHIGDGVKSFDRAAMICCLPNRLLKWERFYIEQLLPEYNNCTFTRSLRFVGRLPLETEPWPSKLDANDAARYLGVDIETLQTWQREGRAPIRVRSPRSRTGLYPLSALRAYATTMPTAA